MAAKHHSGEKRVPQIKARTHTHACTDMHARTEHMTGPWAVKYAAAPKNAGRI